MKSTIPTSERFASIGRPQVPRSRFDLSHSVKTTFADTVIYPVMVEEVLPGDTWDVKLAHVVRLLTPLNPLMDNVFVDFHFFFVPNRLVWTNWERFNGAQDNPGDSTDFLVPIIDTAGGFNMPAIGGGIYYFWPRIRPINIPANGAEITSLVFRGFHLIWDQWYRDEDLQDSHVGSVILPDLGDGPDPQTIGSLAARNKTKDYFTSCRPDPQKGPDVLLPMGTTAPVIDAGSAPTFTSSSGGAYTSGLAKLSGNAMVGWTAGAAVGSGGMGWANTGLEADLASALGPSVNAFREAVTVQQVYERDSRGGTRYVEHLLNHWGVVSPDFRLQRTEFIGGGRSRVGYNSVPATAETTGLPQGNLAGMATATNAGIGFVKSFVEHGHIFCLMSVKHDSSYQQGLDRMYSRRSRFEYYLPTLANLGEEGIPNKELYFQGDAASTNEDNDPVGYQERWARYRFAPSYVMGAMHSEYPGGSLDSWHLAYDFADLPALDGLIVADMPIERTVATSSDELFACDLHFSAFATRPLPVRSTPGLSRL